MIKILWWLFYNLIEHTKFVLLAELLLSSSLSSLGMQLDSKRSDVKLENTRSDQESRPLPRCCWSMQRAQRIHNSEEAYSFCYFELCLPTHNWGGRELYILYIYMYLLITLLYVIIIIVYTLEHDVSCLFNASRPMCDAVNQRQQHL